MPKEPEYSLTLRYRGGTQGHVGQSVRAHYRESITTMYHVLYVECLLMLMIPAKATCPSSWIREYYGYIMTEWKGRHNSNVGHTMFECVDRYLVMVMLITLMVPCFTMSKQRVITAFPVHLTTQRRNSTVSCAQSNKTYLYTKP